MDKRFFGLVLLVLVVVSLMETDAKLCTAPSSTFKYLCISDQNCSSACEQEGFTSGECEGLRRRCICGKPCGMEVSKTKFDNGIGGE
ncbi:defensin D2-like [Actinidia eriantha]|uniref:defensin D2-like n=1 Tax=Actinidia eriantha TaxID=165200 RepID=UPI00258E8610|nr:defensin D2-like [Actinidia eriantha]